MDFARRIEERRAARILAAETAAAATAQAAAAALPRIGALRRAMHECLGGMAGNPDFDAEFGTDAFSEYVSPPGRKAAGYLAEDQTDWRCTFTNGNGGASEASILISVPPGDGPATCTVQASPRGSGVFRLPPLAAGIPVSSPGDIAAIVGDCMADYVLDRRAAAPQGPRG